MSWILQPADKQKVYSWRLNQFTNEELDRILVAARQLDVLDGQIVSKPGVHQNNNMVRKSRISWIPTDHNFAWLWSKLAGIVEQENQENYRFDLNYIETLQFTEYSDEYEGFYGKHLDLGEGHGGFRKFTFILQLTDPETYTGGDVFIHSGPLPRLMPRERGAMVFFPSYMLHEVTPVTQGLRNSLVGWVSGPRFK